MKTVAIVALLLVCIATQSFAASIIDPNGVRRDQEAIEQWDSPRGDEEVCATALLNFFWGAAEEDGIGTPRFAELYFYNNHTFVDNSYHYSGSWVRFGENGEDILVFNYPSAMYVSPTMDGEGSMVANYACGTWYFDSEKWYCPSSCA